MNYLAIMAMVISGRAKALLVGILCFMLIGAVIVAGSTNGWFVSRRYNGERTAARIQVKYSSKYYFWGNEVECE